VSVPTGRTAEGGPVFAGAATAQKTLPMDVAGFFAVCVARAYPDECPADVAAMGAAALERHLPPGLREGPLYLAQCDLTSGAPSAVRSLLAGAARSVVPSCAAAAAAAAASAVDGTGAVPGAQVNLWMCTPGSGGGGAAVTTTDTHYDGYRNLLCVLDGAKTVSLWPPDTPALCRRAVAWANHAGEAAPGAAVYEVAAGDALYIPDGWWHRVASTSGTCAVNVWWDGARADVLKACPPVLDTFALRTLLHRAVETRLKAAVDAAVAAAAARGPRVDWADALAGPTAAAERELLAGVPLGALALGQGTNPEAWARVCAELSGCAAYAVTTRWDAAALGADAFDGVLPEESRVALWEKREAYARAALAELAADVVGIDGAG